MKSTNIYLEEGKKVVPDSLHPSSLFFLTYLCIRNNKCGEKFPGKKRSQFDKSVPNLINPIVIYQEAC